ncbi:hypothetical protein E2562_000147 [Oryza meyeriana var. granulata]|uniref:SKP1-like protein n=1 Tax=Oryza meyeriana var. granulata TaxID=110450 RepID=A0A6G1DDN7_9ORYZ|nr:hypothetical protein E2562_000147 [Oryza meyeriana var. granulata]
MAAAKEGTNAGNMILLISSDGEHFELPEAAARLSNVVSNMIEDDCTQNGIPLPNVTSNVLAKIAEYCTKHAAIGSSTDVASSSSSSAAATTAKKEELRSFDARFIDVDKAMLFDLLIAANYMSIKGLVDLASQRVADLIMGKSPEEIRKEFMIENDFTPEEEAAIRKENAWAFEGM